MAKKRKNKFNHNSVKNAQKQCKKEKKLDNINQIKKDFPATNTNVNNKANNGREKVDLLETITQKIAFLGTKPKAWLKTQAKILNDAFRSQLMPQIKTIAKAIDGKISIFNKIKHNFKSIRITSTLEIISESNKIENSSIQHISQSSPPLPKLMALNVTPSAQLERVINNLLQSYYEENAPKNKIKPKIGNKHFTTSTPDISAIFDIQIPNKSNNSKNKKGAQRVATDLNNSEKNNFNPQENTSLYEFETKKEIIILENNNENNEIYNSEIKLSTNMVQPLLKVSYDTYGDCNYGEYDYDDDSNSSESGQEFIEYFLTRFLDSLHIIDYSSR
jgi:hypothetical protein